MGFNYGLEKKKFDAEWARLRVEYAAAGMDERSIQIMYEYDLKVFNRRRADAMHEQSIDGMRDCHFEDVSDDRSPLLVKFESEFSTRDDYFATGRLGWLEAFDNEKLYALILTFSERDKELLALIIEGYSRSEIADMRGVSVQAINKKINKIKKLMEGVVF